ncbi:MAG: diacylglycerol kinase family protein [Anaerolineales bacterium]
MDQPKVIFIINPNANMGQAWRQAADLRPIMQEFGVADWTGSVYPTHAIELTRKAVEDGYDLIIAGGGDGTVHEVVNALMSFPEERRPALGVVPLGSGNDFSYSIGMEPEPWKALRQIFNGQEKRVDIGEIEDDSGRTEYFDNTIGIGFDAIVTIHSHKMPFLRGYPMYIAAVLKTIFFNHHPIGMNITIDDQPVWEDRILMLTLCNGIREGGGFMIYPPAELADGMFNFVAVQEVSRLILLRLVPAFMQGSHLTHPKIVSGDFNKISIQADQPLFIHLDGEVFSGFSSDVKNVKVKLHPKAIRVIS